MKDFKLPDNYFDNFAQSMDAKIAELEQEKKSANKPPLNKTIRITLSAAAVVIILVTSGLFISTQQNNSDINTTTPPTTATGPMATSTSINDLSNEEYMELMLDELDPAIIEEIISDANYNY